MNTPIVEYEPFAPIADLERQVEELSKLSAALVEDQTALCQLLADKTQQVARLEQEVKTLQRQRGQYRFQQPAVEVVRYRAQGE